MALRLATYYHAEDVPPLPGSNVFYSVEMLQALQQTKGFRPVLLVAYEDGRAVGKLLCITRRSLRFRFSLQKHTCTATGEYFPSSYRKDEIFRELLEYLTRCFKDRSFLLEFRNLEESLFGYRHFRECGYFPVRWMRVRNSIHGNCIDKWMSISRKRQINRGLKGGGRDGYRKDGSRSGRIFCSAEALLFVQDSSLSSGHRLFPFFAEAVVRAFEDLYSQV